MSTLTDWLSKWYCQFDGITVFTVKLAGVSGTGVNVWAWRLAKLARPKAANDIKMRRIGLLVIELPGALITNTSGWELGVFMVSGVFMVD